MRLEFNRILRIHGVLVVSRLDSAQHRWKYLLDTTILYTYKCLVFQTNQTK